MVRNSGITQYRVVINKNSIKSGEERTDAILEWVNQQTLQSFDHFAEKILR